MHQHQPKVLHKGALFSMIESASLHRLRKPLKTYGDSNSPLTMELKLSESCSVKWLKIKSFYAQWYIAANLQVKSESSTKNVA